MTSIGPPLAFMTVDSGTRWLPERLKPFGSKLGRGAALGTNRWPPAAIPSVGVQIVGERCRRVESSVD